MRASEVHFRIQTYVYVVVNVAPSLRHRREKDNVYTDVEISLAQSVLGGTIKVPGVYEDTVIRVPPGTASHSVLCLKGRGIKRLNQAGQGDQFINVKIRVPK